MFVLSTKSLLGRGSPHSFITDNLLCIPKLIASLAYSITHLKCIHSIKFQKVFSSPQKYDPDLQPMERGFCVWLHDRGLASKPRRQQAVVTMALKVARDQEDAPSCQSNRAVSSSTTHRSVTDGTKSGGRPCCRPLWNRCSSVMVFSTSSPIPLKTPLQERWSSFLSFLIRSPPLAAQTSRRLLVVALRFWFF